MRGSTRTVSPPPAARPTPATARLSTTTRSAVETNGSPGDGSREGIQITTGRSGRASGSTIESRW
jgi:hypothetical protein